MRTRFAPYLLLAPAALLAIASPARADTFQFSTGSPDGLIATASQPAGSGQLEIETADDFVLTNETDIFSGTFTGLLTNGTSSADVGQVVLEFYRVFPLDSTVPPSGSVTTRANSPSDVALASLDSAAGELTFTLSTLSSSFTAANSVINGIHPSPNETTGGEGSVTGQEVQFSFTLPIPLDLQAGHYFFVPQVQVTGGNFLWLSAPGASFPQNSTDLQSWIRNENLAPDWLRIGTDIVGQGRYNAAFSLNGNAVPEPATWAMMIAGFGAVGLASRRRRRRERLLDRR
jgi:hypothetical protein